MIFIYRISFCLFYLWSLTVHAEVHIKITTGVDSARPIGIVPFKLSGLDIVPENISDIITNDLYNSG